MKRKERAGVASRWRRRRSRPHQAREECLWRHVDYGLAGRRREELSHDVGVAVPAGKRKHERTPGPFEPLPEGIAAGTRKAHDVGKWHEERRSLFWSFVHRSKEPRDLRPVERATLQIDGKESRHLQGIPARVERHRPPLRKPPNGWLQADGIS
jgi:hypothetical protein